MNLSETKSVVMLDGQIIHVGEWDYMYFNDIPENPLPDGATIETKEMEYTSEDGWHEVGYIKPLTQRERIDELEQTLNFILLGGSIK